MKLGLALDYAVPQLELPIDLIREAEALGFDAVWSAEAYGSDAITPLAYIAAHTERIRLGTSVVQVSARAPTVLAMQLATLDQLAGGDRVLCGIGLSGPQVVEGWHGMSWARPAARLRDCVSIVRKTLSREAPVSHDGLGLQLPYRGADASGYGKPLKSILHMNPGIPLYLGTGSRATVALTAEIADGWIPMGFVPGMMSTYGPWLEDGFARAQNTRTLQDLEIICPVQMDLTDDVRGAIDQRKVMAGMYVGGMGAAGKNFHADQMARRGFPEAAARIGELFRAGHRDEAIAAVPDEYIDQAALLGPPERIRSRFRQWQESEATSMIVHLGAGDPFDSVRLLASLAR
ncbi:MAG: LLM class F420-dependent oxidoreductase [Pseudomonadota bacterium]